MYYLTVDSFLSCQLSELLHYLAMVIENLELKLAGICWRLRSRKFILISSFGMLLPQANLFTTSSLFMLIYFILSSLISCDVFSILQSP